MHATPKPDAFPSTLDLDPLASMRMHGSALVDLAFGSLTRSAIHSPSRPRDLAFLPAETLELDLTDPAQRQFGDYELLELIGEGGMGVVYRARQASLDREVAVKLLAAGPWASREFVERFRREAQNAARMQHPSIVAIYEVGSAEELHFFSMRLIRGSSLASVIKREGRQPALRAAILMRTIAEAVDYAHRLGVLHLDLKPANVLVDENGAPHVADFGLARRLDNTLAADNDEISGTPSYMAPEQAQVRTQKITPATDIWGLGAILYELVTGQPPFLGESPQATLKLVLGETVRSPRSLVPDLSRDVEAIILKCMARDSSGRYPTARALADDLGRFIEGRAVVARPLNRVQRLWRWAKRQPYIAALAALFTLSLLVGIVGVTTQWRRAENNAAVATQRLWQSRRDTALHLQSDGKGFDALPSLVTNIEEKEHAADRTSSNLERIEVGNILGQGVVLLDRMVLPDAAHAAPMAVDVSPDGSRLAIALTDLTVHWFDTHGMRELGKVDLLGQPTSTGQPLIPVLVRFVDNHRLRVNLEWQEIEPAPAENDSYLIDLDRAAPVAFPAAFTDLVSAAFSADGGYALLHNRSDEMQVWRVQPWQPVSAKVANSSSINTTILGRDARFVVTIGNGMRTVDIYDAHELSKPERLTLPASQALSAWAESSDGKYLALGDIEGRIMLLDLHTRQLRQLATPRGRQVTWITFSEDDNWLAAVRRDGAAYVFDAATGNPIISGQMQHEFELRYVSVSHSQRLLLASGPGKSALWHLPQAGPTAVPASRVTTSPIHASFGGPYALGFSTQSGLLATAESDGEVRLWRAPASPILAARAAQQIAASLQFDGRRIVDVESNHLRLVTPGGTALTEWIDLPQRPGFAELVDAGRSLLVTCGTQLRVYDSVNMQLRFAPITLEANPLRLAVTADGHAAVLSFVDSSTAAFNEHLVRFDLASGQRDARDARLEAPLRQLEFSGDGTRLLANGPPGKPLHILRGDSLQPFGKFQPVAPSGVIWAAFDANADQLTLAVRSIDSRSDDAELIHWNSRANRIDESHALNRIWPVGVLRSSHGTLLAGRDVDLLNAGDAGQARFERQTQSEATAVIAVSHDGRTIAHAFTQAVQLYDAETAGQIGPVLNADINGLDVIAQLAFSPDDKQLLARTIQGQWLLWTIAPDERPVAVIAQDARLLGSATAGRAVHETLSAAQRRTLTERDPGPWRRAEKRPVAVTAREIDSGPIPMRGADLSGNLLDLTDAYNQAPDSVNNRMSNVIAVMRVLPFGVLRLAGVDYDVRGAMQLRSGYNDSNRSGFWSHSQRIAVPDVPIAAIDILLLPASFYAGVDDADYAYLNLHYRDGSNATVTLRTDHEVPSGGELVKGLPLAWVWGDENRLTGDFYQHLIGNPRLLNPHPERLIESLDLQVPEQYGAQGPGPNPAVFAITVEPVISPRKSGSNQ